MIKVRRMISSVVALLTTSLIRIEGPPPDPRWLRERERFVREQAARFRQLSPRLPVVYRLDPDFVTAAKRRQSIEVVDDCGEALCGVPTDELPEPWQIADIRAMFTPAGAPRALRDAYAVALLGRFAGEDVDRWAADELQAGVFRHWRDLPDDDALAFVPAAASLIRFLDPQHAIPFPAIRKRLENVDDRGWLAKLRAIPPRPRDSATARPLYGATFSIVNRIERSAIADPSRLELERLARLGYNAISLLPFAGQRGSGATSLRRFARHPASETDLAMSLAAMRAHRLGLCVMLKPHVWNWPSGDPTQIDPGTAGWPAWFASYRKFIVHEALLARAIHADWLCIGTELTHSENRPEWKAIIAAVRALFTGPITYAANFDAFEKTPFWNALDAIGIDAYFPLASSAHASDADLHAGAANVIARIDRLTQRFRRLTILTELGYSSAPAPWIEPWNERRQTAAAPADQARAFTAIFEMLAPSNSVLGFFIWKYESDPSLRESVGYLPKEKPAETVIQRILQRSKGHRPCSK
jgi:glycosyl hydrolase family 113